MSGSIRILTREVRFRDDSGRFLGEVDVGTRAAVEELVTDGADLARVFAPFKTGALAATIRGLMIGEFTGVITAGTDHAEAQEFGAGPHPIGDEGQNLANPEEEFFAKGPVMHPGNPATRFMTKATRTISRFAPAVFRKNLP